MNEEDKLYRLAYNSTMRVPQKPMNKMSKKRAKFYREVYQPLKDDLLGGECEAKIPDVCTGTSEHLHEILSRGRAGGLEAAIRDSDVLAVCDRCNGWISENPLKSLALGLLKHYSPENKDEL